MAKKKKTAAKPKRTAKKKPAKKAAAKAKPKAKRSAGRPSTKKAIGPKELDQIADWMAQGYTQTWMAEQLGVCHTTVSRAIDQRILPTLQSPKYRGPEAILGAMEYMYRRCWEMFNDGAPAEIRKATAAKLAAKSKSKPASQETVEEVFRPNQIAWLKLAFEIKKEIATLLKYRNNATMNFLRFDRSDEEFRVAGATPSEIDAQMVARLARLVSDRAEYEAALSAQNLLPSQLSDGNTIEQST